MKYHIHFCAYKYYAIKYVVFVSSASSAELSAELWVSEECGFIASGEDYSSISIVASVIASPQTPVAEAEVDAGRLSPLAPFPRSLAARVRA